MVTFKKNLILKLTSHSAFWRKIENNWDSVEPTGQYSKSILIVLKTQVLKCQMVFIRVTKVCKVINFIENVIIFFLSPKFLFPDAASEKPLDGTSSTDNSNPPLESEEYVS